MPSRRFSFFLSTLLMFGALTATEPGWMATTNRKPKLQSAAQAPPAIPSSDKAYLTALEKQIAGNENKPAEEVFKNIQLLKGFPAQKVLKVMEIAFVPGLGVSCTHCHVPDAWEKEDKETKQITRTMWQLQMGLNKQIKEQVGRGAVNCYTCHRGSTKPALRP